MDGYSRLVAWLRVLLPLTALGLLSTLFLLSRNTEVVAPIPFADGELSDRVAGEQMTEPFFSGMSSTGDRITISAGTMRTSAGQASDVDDFSGQIDLKGGTRIILLSQAGRFDLAQMTSLLTGDVVITTSTGFTMNTDTLEVDLDATRITAPYTQAKGPLGRLTSGQMVLEQRGATGAAHFVFNKGVKLVYDPKDSQK